MFNFSRIEGYNGMRQYQAQITHPEHKEPNQRQKPLEKSEKELTK